MCLYGHTPHTQTQTHTHTSASHTHTRTHARTCTRRVVVVRRDDGASAPCGRKPMDWPQRRYWFHWRRARTPPLSPKPRAPVSAAGVGVCGGYPRVSQPRAFPTTPPLTICGYPTVQYRYPRTNLCACIYPLLLLRSHAATGITLVRRKRTVRKTPGDTTECGSGVYRVTA